MGDLSMKSLLKNIANICFGPYEVWTIWRRDPLPEPTDSDFPIRVVSGEELARESDPEIRSLASYDGADAVGFGTWQQGLIGCACWYWFGKRYETQRAFIKLGPNEAKLVQITTAAAARGQGLAARLISTSGSEMAKRGFTRLYARIWMGHKASEGAFRRAGWERIGRAMIFTVPVIRRTVRLNLPF